MGTPPAPARIWGLLASEADRVVLFRRGPSQWTRVYLWDTATDTLTPGSWFQGRLYEWMSDLSPDGEHLLYAARNESRRQQALAMERYGVTMDGWTGLSRPPSVRALGLWSALAGDMGGVFLDGRTINVVGAEALIRPTAFTVVPSFQFDPLVALRQTLPRTGWHVVREPARWYGMGEAEPFTLRKRTLELNFSRAQYHWFVRYRWLADGPAPDLEGATWADLDRRGRLLIARAGRAFIWHGGQETQLADLNADQPPRPVQPA
ncbi:hypothetical protein [Deinococcus sp. RM]|uniref:hypothetical protein n=1 Tax=Deinococcus sp. RM TaxID=2316359 RepID=UPI000E67C76A|nr:hypothetical protein [Deinococcus sp. RM]RIY12750.1 hypothetical protein D3W47_05360 [Deinococcus sp. RM]